MQKAVKVINDMEIEKLNMNQTGSSVEVGPSLRYPDLSPHSPQTTDIEILEKRAHLLAKPLDDGNLESEVLRLVTFPLGEESYGLDICQVQGIQPLGRETWSCVPCTPEFIIGVINVRGRIYSVMDIACFMGSPSRSLSKSAHVILVHGGNQSGKGYMELCILADAVPEVINISPADLHTPTEAISTRVQPFLQGVTREMMIVLDLDRLLSESSILVQEEV